MSNADDRPDSVGSLEIFLQEQHTNIRDTVDLVCRIYRFPVPWDVIDDLTGEIEYLLLKDDFRHLRSFKHKSSFKTWLKQIALHHISHHIQRQRRNPLRLDEIPTRSLCCQPTQEEALLNSDRLRQVRRAVGKLSEREKMYLRLCFIEEMEAGEMALHLGIRVESVYERKSVILRKLRRLIQSQSKTGTGIPSGRESSIAATDHRPIIK